MVVTKKLEKLIKEAKQKKDAKNLAIYEEFLNLVRDKDIDPDKLLKEKIKRANNFFKKKEKTLANDEIFSVYLLSLTIFEGQYYVDFQRGNYKLLNKFGEN